jgi:hypothetical protein
MSIPLDRLYQYIERTANNLHGNVIIYRFFPHGQKNLNNLGNLYSIDWISQNIYPHIICHDQEPLNFELYCNQTRPDPWNLLLDKYNCYNSHFGWPTIFDQQVLLHSEQRSSQVETYQNNQFIPVYYWCHAVIALDWFRFAQYIEQKKQNKNLFLIYNRAWGGTREYRLKFTDLLLENQIEDFCHIRFNAVDPELALHYDQHCFHNPCWKPTRCLENFFISNNATSNYSADFDLSDYESTDIEIVLETLFDDDRLHLTEKSLRPISCGQPFILCASHGALKYLRDYGFKTFDSIWDESYDTIKNPIERLNAITKLMKQISLWSHQEKIQKLEAAIKIANYNKKYFFSQPFFDRIDSELKNNLEVGLNKLISTNTSTRFINQRIKMAQYPELRQILIGEKLSPNIEAYSLHNNKEETVEKVQSIMKILKQARLYYKSNS